jgi:hypothetical protein
MQEFYMFCEALQTVGIVVVAIVSVVMVVN